MLLANNVPAELEYRPLVLEVRMLTLFSKSFSLMKVHVPIRRRVARIIDLLLTFWLCQGRRTRP